MRRVAPALAALPAVFAAVLALVGLPALSLLAAAQGGAATAAPEIQVEVEPRSGEVGLVMTVTVKVSGPEAADCHLLEVPEVAGARLELREGPVNSQSTYIVNGRVTRNVTTEWRLALVPTADGVLRLPPFRLNCRGTTFASEPLVVPVHGNTVPADAVQLVVTWPAGEVWAGQVFDVTVDAMLAEEYADRIIQGGLQLTLAWYEGAGGLVRLDSPPSPGRVEHVYLNGGRNAVATTRERRTVGDRSFLVYRLPVRMLASRAGNIALPGSYFSATVATEVSQRRDPFFRNTQTVATRVVEAKAESPPRTLLVRAPPEADRPPGYTNAVGRFELAGAAAPRSLRVGQTCTLSLKLTGSGNLEFVNWPDFEALSKDFRIFGKEEKREPGVRVLALEVSPKNEHVSAVPALELPTFDPERGRYEVLSVGPFPLEVQPGGEGGLAELAEPEEILNDLETIREMLPAPTSPPLPWWLWLLPGAALLAVVEVRGRLQRWRRDNPHEVARRGARVRLDKALEAAEGTRDVAVAFGKFLADRLDGPPAGLTVEEAVERLAARHRAGHTGAAKNGPVDADHLAAEMRKIVSGWEASYLGGRKLDRKVVWSEARYLADLVEDAT